MVKRRSVPLKACLLFLMNPPTSLPARMISAAGTAEMGGGGH